MSMEKFICFQREYIYMIKVLEFLFDDVTSVQSINQTQWTRKIVLDISHWTAVYRANWACFLNNKILCLRNVLSIAVFVQDQ